MINWLSSEMNERSKASELSLNSDGIQVKLVYTGKPCHAQRRRKCIFESIISTGTMKKGTITGIESPPS